MSQFDSRRHGSRSSGTSVDRTAQPSVGKQTLVQQQYDGLPSSKADAPRPSGGNASLPEPVQTKMESALQTNLSNVVIHSDSQQAVEAGAQAFTRGNEIHFAPGKYQPDSQAGQELLGHELTHVVQQRQGRVSDSATLGKAIALNNDAGLEREADDMGARAARGEQVGLGASTADTGAGVMQRKPVRPTPKEGMIVWLTAGTPSTHSEHTVESYDPTTQQVKLKDIPALVAEAALEYNRPLGKNHMSETSEDASWKSRDDPKPRSRYSFAPLVQGKMIVTLTMQKSQQAGHTHIAFEWWDPYQNDSHHYVFEFNPTKTDADREHNIVSKTKGVPGEVQENTDRNYLPNQKNDQDIQTRFRSWELDYHTGDIAFQGAKKLKANPPIYKLMGGNAQDSFNCHTMAKHLAEQAGIKVDTHRLEKLFTVVPALFKGHPLDGKEEDMANRATPEAAGV